MDLESKMKMNFGQICKYAYRIYTALLGIQFEQFADDNDDYYWYLGSKLGGISESNC